MPLLGCELPREPLLLHCWGSVGHAMGSCQGPQASRFMAGKLFCISGGPSLSEPWSGQAPLSCELRDSGVPAQHFAQPRVEEATERGRAPGRVPATFPRGYLALGRGPKPEPPQVAARRQEDQCSGYGVRPEVSKSAVQAQCGRGEGRGHRSRG
nr:tetraspanin-4 isoform X4 [Manis javanica]